MRIVDPAPGKSGTDNRILGLKVRQAAFLGSLAAIDCLLLIAGVVIMLGSLHASTSNIISAPPPTASLSLPETDILLQSGETPGSTTTVEFSNTAGAPAATQTPLPSPTSLTEGWIRIGVKEVEIRTPATYAGGDPHADSKAIMDDLRVKGANYDFDFLEEKMTTSSENTVLWAIDSRQGNPAVVTNVVVLYDYPRPGEPLSEYTMRFVGATFGDLILVEQQTIPSSAYEIERTILETKEGQGTPMSFVYYAILDQDIVWDILCVTATDEFGARLPQFDILVGTFRVLSPPS
jgi:hypothetical protein